MRKFKNKETGAIYNVTVESIAKFFEDSTEYVEIKKTKNKKDDKVNASEEKTEK